MLVRTTGTMSETFGVIPEGFSTSLVGRDLVPLA